MVRLFPLVGYADPFDKKDNFIVLLETPHMPWSASPWPSSSPQRFLLIAPRFGPLQVRWLVWTGWSSDGEALQGRVGFSPAVYGADVKLPGLRRDEGRFRFDSFHEPRAGRMSNVKILLGTLAIAAGIVGRV